MGDGLRLVLYYQHRFVDGPVEEDTPCQEVA